jgi:hypothetical protein
MSELMLALSDPNSCQERIGAPSTPRIFNLEDPPSLHKLNALFQNKRDYGVTLLQSTEILLQSEIGIMRRKINESQQISESSILAHRILDRLERRMSELPPATAEKVKARVLDLLEMHKDANIAYWVCGVTTRGDLYRLINEPEKSDIADVYSGWSQEELTVLFEILGYAL